MILSWESGRTGKYNHPFDQHKIQLFCRLMCEPAGEVINEQRGLKARGDQFPSCKKALSALCFFHHLACRSDNNTCFPSPTQHEDVKQVFDTYLRNYDCDHAPPFNNFVEDLPKIRQTIFSSRDLMWSALQRQFMWTLIVVMLPFFMRISTAIGSDTIDGLKVDDIALPTNPQEWSPDGFPCWFTLVIRNWKGKNRSGLEQQQVR